MRWRAALVAAGLCLAAATHAPVASAAAFDPRFTWRTLETEHFNITFHGGEEQLAEETGQVAEVIWDEMTTELAWEPDRKVELVLVDNTDAANGYAMTLPVNTIVIYVTAPTENSTLATYEDWMDAILTHELTHILHIDLVEGLPKALRAVFGRIVSVNRLSPGWVVEGHATLQETWHTTGGRGRSTYVDMMKRMAVLEDVFPPLGNLDGFQRAWPQGNLRYLWGQDFQRYIADRAGRNVWTDFFHMYGGQVVPWVLPDQKAFGEEILQLYGEWRADSEARYERQRARIEADPLTEFRVLSDGDDYCGAPTFSPDGGQLVWSCADWERGSAVWLAAGDGTQAKLLLDQRFGSDFAWRGDGRALAFSSQHVVNRFNSFSDVYLYEIGGGIRPLTSGDRARNPAFSPDGRELLVVTNEVQNNQLKRLTVDQRVEALTDFTDHTQISTPRFSPDGAHLVASVWRDGARDLWIFDKDARPVRRVTADLATDVDPWWSADGRTIYFSSDRTGVYNLYAIDLETERLWQVTNVLGGAFGPSTNPDESALVFESYSANGLDIAWMDVDRSQWIDRGLVSRPLVDRTPLATVLPPEGFVPVTQAEPRPPRTKDPSLWQRIFRKPGPPLPPSAAPETAAAGPPEDTRRRRAAPPPVGSSLLDPLVIPGLDGAGLPPNFGPEALHGPGSAALEARDAPIRGVDVDEPSRIESETPEEQDYPFSFPVERYRPLPSLVPPRYLVPGVAWTGFGFLGALSTGGTDVLRRHAYGASATWRLDTNDPALDRNAGFVGWSASYVFNRYIPVFSTGVSRFAVPYSSILVQNAPPVDGGTWVPSLEDSGSRYWEKRTVAYAQVSYPVDIYSSVFGRWTGSFRQSLTPVDTLDAQLGTVYRAGLANRGVLSTLSAGWSRARGNFYNMSISPENARSVSGVVALAHPALGSFFRAEDETWEGFTRLQVIGEWREYRSLPWFTNHVLAWKAGAGVSLGDNERFGAYRLGGSFGSASFTALPPEWRSLRGFEPQTVFGDTYYLGSLEYRFPLFYFDRGVGTVPLFLRELSAAVFVDAGNAFNSTAEDPTNPFETTLVGAGAELRGSLIALWGVGLQGRAGYAVPLRGPGMASAFDGFYAWLGSSF